MGLIASVMDANLWILLISGGIFALLYTNAIIMCKYSAIFIKKTVKKEPLTQNEIYFLITSIIIFVVIGVVFTPKESISHFIDKGIMDILETLLVSIIGYIFFLLLSSTSIIIMLFSLKFTHFFFFLRMAILMWVNLIILCKYFYRFIRKIIKKELPTQKEIIYLITSIMTFITIGVSYAFAISHI